MIVSYADRETERLASGNRVKRLEAIARSARKKLVILDAAVEIKDLNTPPGNRLEALAGHRQGQYSIRINDQYRICFKFKEHRVYDVEITDYHT